MSVSRRRFLKGSAAAAGALAAVKLGSLAGPAAGGVAYAGKTGERLDDLYDIDANIQRFNEKNVMFARAKWDAPIIEWAKTMGPNSQKLMAEGNPGYRVLDFAFRNAGWAVVNMIGSGTGAGTRTPAYYPSGVYVDRPMVSMVPPNPVELSPEQATRAVKKVAKFLGADLVGITHLDERWLYSGYFCRGGNTAEGPIVVGDFEKAGLQEDGTLGIPRSMKYVIALAFKQDLTAARTGTTFVASSTVGQGYMDMAIGSYGLSEFIWGLGYQALPSGNDLGLSTPFAVAAGLGEMGRSGILVTMEHGPNVRLAKVVTDLPLIEDKPRDFGVREFCNACKKCADLCPSGAIPHGAMQKEAVCMSNLPGTLKWHVDVEKCYKFWNDNGCDCAQCQGICPYTKDGSIWTHALGAKLAPTFGSAFVKLDDMLGYGQIDADRFWNED